MSKTLLWWTHRPAPDYSRNRIVRQQLEALGWKIVDFKPAISALGDWQARFTALPPHDAVWVPCFRQRDVAAARRYARRRGVPLIFDPLISAWDKQVYERQKFSEQSPQARRLLGWESRLFQSCDRVIADTAEHADFFRQRFGVAQDALAVVPVGAEEDLFTPTPIPDAAIPEVLFVGSFIGLQGPETIVEAARRYQGPHARFTLLGDGPLKPACIEAARGLENVHFESWLDYRKLPERIARAQLLLGVFGSSQKAGRVIPNKAYQALAAGRPLITRDGPSWQDIAAGPESGVWLVAPGDPQALAHAIGAVLSAPERLAEAGKVARETYDRHLSEKRVRESLARLFASLGLD